MKAVARREIDMVVAWSVDRLGRSPKNLIEVLSDYMRKALTFICTSKAWTRPRQVVGRCFK